jgi:hypothetical protein
MIELVNLDYAHAYVEPEKKCVTVVWKKKIVMTLEQFQFVYNTIVEYHRKNPMSFIISDVREQGVMPPNYRKWFQEYALVEAVKGGLKKVAVIFDGNVFKKYYLNHIFDSSKKFGVPMIFVGNTAEAYKWFASGK